MEVYFSNSGLGKAIFVPQKKLVVCPFIDRSLDGHGGDIATLDFFPRQEELKREFERRLEKPENNESFYNMRFWYSNKVKPFPVKYKQLPKKETNELENFIVSMRSISKPKIWLGSFSKEELNKDIESAIRELERRTFGLRCFQEYGLFYQRVYASAKWVGASEEAAEWYKHRK